MGGHGICKCASFAGIPGIPCAFWLFVRRDPSIVRATRVAIALGAIANIVSCPACSDGSAAQRKAPQTNTSRAVITLVPEPVPPEEPKKSAPPRAAEVRRKRLGRVHGDREVIISYDPRICEDRAERGVGGAATNVPWEFALLLHGARPQRFTVTGAPTDCEGRASKLSRGDFNFDGAEDFSIENGRGGPYGSQTEAVFVFDPRTRSYVEAPALEKITVDHMGFEVDRKRRRLVALSKSGCCIHYTSEFAVKGLDATLLQTKTETFDVDANGKCTFSVELTGPKIPTRTTTRRCTREEELQ